MGLSRRRGRQLSAQGKRHPETKVLNSWVSVLFFLHIDYVTLDRAPAISGWLLSSLKWEQQ